MRLTGNIRFRPSLFGKVILQVEFEYDVVVDPSRGGRREPMTANHIIAATSKRREWRDARMRDMDVTISGIEIVGSGALRKDTKEITKKRQPGMGGAL